MNQRTLRVRLLICALGILPLAALGCGEIPPDSPSPEEVKEFLRREFHDRLVIDPLVILPPGTIPPLPTLPPDPYLSIRSPEQPIAPPPTIRMPGVQVGAKLAEIKLGKGTFKDGTWTLPFEAMQELTGDLCEVVTVPETIASLGWSDADYRQACETALRCFQYPSLLEKRREVERIRTWAVEVKHRSGSKHQVDGTITAKRLGGPSSPYHLELISAAPKETWSSNLTSTYGIPKEIARFDRASPQKGAVEWAQPFNEFIEAVQKCKDFELGFYRKLSPEMVATTAGFAAALASVKDEASARAAIPVIEKLALRAASIQRAVMKHEAGKSPTRLMAEFDEEIQPLLEKPATQLRDEGRRIKADPALWEIVGPAIVQFSTIKDGKIPPAGKR